MIKFLNNLTYNNKMKKCNCIINLWKIVMLIKPITLNRKMVTKIDKKIKLLINQNSIILTLIIIKSMMAKIINSYSTSVFYKRKT
jgi:hypothetical protein